MRHLVKLTVSRCGVIGKGISLLACCKKLRLVDLTCTNLDDQYCAEIGALHQITELVLVGTRISSITPIRNLRSLESLYLTGTSVGDVDMQFLLECKSLKLLHLEATRITDAGVHTLVKLPKLELTRRCVSNAPEPSPHRNRTQCGVSIETTSKRRPLIAGSHQQRIRQWAHRHRALRSRVAPKSYSVRQS
jgi:hypothetical protein